MLSHHPSGSLGAPRNDSGYANIESTEASMRLRCTRGYTVTEKN